jgi:hypothetical protein
MGHFRGGGLPNPLAHEVEGSAPEAGMKLSPRMIADAQHIAIAPGGLRLLEIRSPQEVLQDEPEGQGI